MVILELIRASKPDFSEGLYLLDTEPILFGVFWMIHNKRTERMACADAVSFKFLTYHAVDGRVLAYHGIDG